MAGYYWGHSSLEMDRLMAQAMAVRPITARLLHQAGLRPGMRVLDIGCGAGCVSLLLAEQVDKVVGVDVSEQAIAQSRRRAEAAGYRNVVFHLATDPAYLEAEPFDFVIGRYVLVHQSDPVGFIRNIAARVRPGGTIAFHEAHTRSGLQIQPPISSPREERGNQLLQHATSIYAAPDAPARMLSLFIEAGLPAPQQFSERVIIDGRNSTLLRWYAHALAAVQQLERPDAPPVAIDAVAAEMGEELIRNNAQVNTHSQYCAWVRL